MRSRPCKLEGLIRKLQRFRQPCGSSSSRYTVIMKFRVVLEYDAQEQSWSAVCPELPGCTSAGVTEDEARQGIAEAIRLYLAPSNLRLPADAKIVEVTVG